MPLSAKGKKIRAKLISEYGKKKGEEVFYAMENKGELKGIKAAHAKKRARVSGASRGGKRKRG